MAGTSSRRLAPRWRKLLLTIHIGSSVGLLGTDATVLLLAVTGARGGDPVAVYPAARLIGSLLLVPAALLSLATGVLLGLLTPWGLVRHWWVTAKLVLTTAGAVLSLTVLTPALADLAGAAGSPIPFAQRLELVRDSGAASVVLVITLVLSVYKPFGRIGRSSSVRRSRTTAGTSAGGLLDGREREGVGLGAALELGRRGVDDPLVRATGRRTDEPVDE
jgi:hypothetical protein